LHTEDKVCSREHWSFKHADEEPQCVKLVDVRDAALRKGADSPEDFEGGEKPSRPRQSEMPRYHIEGAYNFGRDINSSPGT
jgi:hypothetical protein